MWVFSILTLVGMGGIYFMQGNRYNNNQERQAEGPPKDDSPVVAQLGDYKITSQMIDKQADRMGQQLGGSPNPQQLMQTIGLVLDSNVQQALNYKLMADNGIELTDQDLSAQVASEEAMEIQQRLKPQLVDAKIVDANATDDQVKAALKKQGQDLDKLAADELANLRKSLADPLEKPHILAAYGQQKLLSKLGEKITVTDEQLMHDLDQVTYKRILIRVTGAADAAKASDVLKSLNSGMSFDAAMDKYSGDRPVQGKSVHDLSTTSPRRDLPPDVRSAIDKLKVGQHSDVVNSPEGSLIYELVSVKPISQADFEKTKDSARKAYRESQAGTVLQKAIDDLKKKNPVDWKEPVYKAGYDLNQLITNPPHLADPKKEIDQLKQIEKTCADTQANDGGVLRDAALFRFAAFELLYQKSPVADQQKLTDEHIEVLKNLFNYIDDTQERINLAELLVGKKDGKGATENLITAAQRNLNEMNDDQMSFTTNTRIVSLEARMENEKLISADDKATLDKALSDWKDAYKQIQDDKKKQAEEERKAKEEQQKEEQKQKVQPSPKAPPPTPTPSAAPTTSSSPTAKPSGKR